MPKANNAPSNRYIGIKKLLDNFDVYYERIINGELDWVQLLEENMKPEAIKKILEDSEDKNDKFK